MTDSTVSEIVSEPLYEHRSLWVDVWRQFRTHTGALVGVGVFLFIVLAVVLGPFFHTIDPQFLDIRNKNLGPTLTHPMGTDNLGRDMLAQVLAGGQVSLAVGVTAMLLSLVLGTIIGILAGFFRALDGLLMRFTDLFLALPLLPLLLVIIMLFRDSLRSAFGPETGIFILIVIVIGITSWMQTARIVRGDVLALKEREFIIAAPFHRHPQPPHGDAPYPAQCAQPDHGFGNTGDRQCHHHRVRVEFSWAWLPVGLSNLGGGCFLTARISCRSPPQGCFGRALPSRSRC